MSMMQERDLNGMAGGCWFSDVTSVRGRAYYMDKTLDALEMEKVRKYSNTAILRGHSGKELTSRSKRFHIVFIGIKKMPTNF